MPTLNCWSKAGPIPILPKSGKSTAWRCFIKSNSDSRKLPGHACWWPHEFPPNWPTNLPFLCKIQAKAPEAVSEKLPDKRTANTLPADDVDRRGRRIFLRDRALPDVVVQLFMQGDFIGRAIATFHPDPSGVGRTEIIGVDPCCLVVFGGELCQVGMKFRRPTRGRCRIQPQ